MLFAKICCRFETRGALVVDDDNFDHAMLLYIIRYLSMILKRNRFFRRSSLLPSSLLFFLVPYI